MNYLISRNYAVSYFIVENELCHPPINLEDAVLATNPDIPSDAPYLGPNGECKRNNSVADGFVMGINELALSTSTIMNEAMTQHDTINEREEIYEKWKNASSFALGVQKFEKKRRYRHGSVALRRLSDPDPGENKSPKTKDNPDVHI